LTLAKAYSEEGWWIPYCTNLDQEDVQAWGELCSLVEDIELGDRDDRLTWQWEQSGRYSSRSLYCELCRRPKVQVTKYLWNYAIPLKIKIFTWQLARGRLSSNDQILTRRGPSDGFCALCGEVEQVDHIFLMSTCPICLEWGSRNAQCELEPKVST
jgi:hypothetical protein